MQKRANISLIFAQIFHECKMVFNSDVFCSFFFVNSQCLAQHDDLFFLLTTCKMQKAERVWCDDLFFSFSFFFEITLQVTDNTRTAAQSSSFFEINCVVVFWDRHCEKTASQSLSYGIFAKPSGHFCTFSSTYAEGEKLEGTLNLAVAQYEKYLIQ